MTIEDFKSRLMDDIKWQLRQAGANAVLYHNTGFPNEAKYFEGQVCVLTSLRNAITNGTYENTNVAIKNYLEVRDSNDGHGEFNPEDV